MELNGALERMKGALNVAPDLDEDSQTVVGIPGSIQVVFVFLSYVRHHHVDQRLHSVMEGCRKTLIPGQLRRTVWMSNKCCNVVEIAG